HPRCATPPPLAQRLPLLAPAMRSSGPLQLNCLVGPASRRSGEAPDRRDAGPTRPTLELHWTTSPLQGASRGSALAKAKGSSQTSRSPVKGAEEEQQTPPRQPALQGRAYTAARQAP